MDGPTIPQSNERFDGLMDDRANEGHFGPAIRPVFLGNLRMECESENLDDLFRRPIIPGYDPIPVDRIDIKRGFGFVFLKDARSIEDKDRAERYVMELNGMRIQRVSDSLRVEFARGDGRVRRKEDERRQRISPCDTLFVVNFQEATTKREDLEMLFSPYGEIVRIDMKKNYAFVQFTTIDSATRAKESTNGGKLDQSVITVEYVASEGRRDRGRFDADRDNRNDRRGSSGFGGRRGVSDGGAPRGTGGRGDGPEYGRGGYHSRDDDYRRRGEDSNYRNRDRSPARDRDRYDDRDRRDRYDDRRDRSDDRRERYDDHRGPARSRSRSPAYRYRSRSPPSYRYRSRTPSPAGRADRGDFRGNGSGGGRGGDDYMNRDRDRDSGARPRNGDSYGRRSTTF